MFTFLLLFPIESIGISSKTLMKKVAISGKPDDAPIRKTMMIPANNGWISGRPSYSAPIASSQPFNYPLPFTPGTYATPTNMMTLNASVPKSVTNNPSVPIAPVQFVNKGGQMYATMTPSQYSNLYNIATGTNMQIISNLPKNEITDTGLNAASAIAANLAQKTFNLGSAGTDVFGNAMKVTTALQSNAENQLVNMYAAKRTSDLAETASSQIGNIQSQTLTTAENKATSTSTPSLPANASYYSNGGGKYVL